MLKREKEVFGYLLDTEEAVMKELEKQYRKALEDINTCIRVMQADELTQSRVYRIQYQQTLKKQVEAILEKLHSDEYTSMQQYLSGTYTDAYVGTVYALHGQSVPVIMPIDQTAAVKAVLTDSKISTDLYTHLGVDIKHLKKTIRNEITRGIASGMLFQDIARNVAFTANTPLNRAKNIVQTEGHRIQQASADDARRHAISRGADLVKQWDSIMDGNTRDTHRRLDGQVREEDEPFEMDGKQAMFPGDFGDPAEDCRCRCVAHSRARSALGADDLKYMQDKAAFWGLDKTKDFEEFKTKYMKAAEHEYGAGQVEGERIAKSKIFTVDTKVIDSRGYADKFDSMTDDKQERRDFLKASKEILHHRSGQNGEDLYLYNRVKKAWIKSTSGTEAGTPAYTDEIKKAIKSAKAGELVSFHNHPASMPPSVDDINAAFANGYSVGYALCHDGTIFEYTPPAGYIRPTIYELMIANYKEKGYNEYDAQYKTIERLAEEFGFVFRKVK